MDESDAFLRSERERTYAVEFVSLVSMQGDTPMDVEKLAKSSADASGVVEEHVLLRMIPTQNRILASSMPLTTNC